MGRSVPVAFQKPRAVVRFGLPPLEFILSLGTKKYHSLPSFLASTAFLPAGKELVSGIFTASKREGYLLRTGELPRVVAVDVAGSDDLLPELLPLDGSLQIIVEQLLLRGVESKPR